MNYKFELGKAQAAELDRNDPLGAFRDRFYVRENEIYMDGNSLGLCCKEAEAAILNMLEVWKAHGINMWGVEKGKYFLYPSLLGARQARLLGADPDEVTITNSTTINIHQCLATFYQPEGKRRKILVDELNFPTDRHAVDSQVLLHGLDPAKDVVVVKSRDGRLIEEDDVIAAMSDEIAVMLMPGVLYRSSQLLDMDRLTAEAHKRGIIVGWDLCHSIGSVPHNLKQTGADFALWCNYKYISGGPGTLAGLYINRRHFGRRPGLAGWHGVRKEILFRLDHDHKHSADADGWLTGTAPMLSLAGIDGSMQVYEEAGMEAIREKSLKITAYLMFLIDQRLAPYGYRVGSPRDDKRRGGHVSLEHDEAYRICQALKDKGVIPDFREPNVIRLAPVALYNTYAEVLKLVDILEEIAANKDYEAYSNARALVV